MSEKGKIISFITVTFQLIPGQNPHVVGIRDTESVKVSSACFITKVAIKWMSLIMLSKWNSR